ncbi:MAG: hypothetical protein U0359_19090 [Byssovorax sp.]
MRATKGFAWFLGAIALLGVACSSKPDPAEVHRDAANEALNAGDWARAAQEFDASLKINPAQAKVWERKAYAHMKAGEIDPCEAALLKQAELVSEPSKKAAVYRNIAGVRMGAGQSAKAEPWFAKAVELDPNDDQSLQWLGEIYSLRGGARDMNATPVPDTLEKAVAYYDRLIKVKPDSSVAYLNKRIALNRIRDFEKQQQQAAEQLLAVATRARVKDSDKIAAAQADVDKHKARVDELGKQFDELSKKLVDLAKTSPPPPS